MKTLPIIVIVCSTTTALLLTGGLLGFREGKKLCPICPPPKICKYEVKYLDCLGKFGEKLIPVENCKAIQKLYENQVYDKTYDSKPMQKWVINEECEEDLEQSQTDLGFCRKQLANCLHQIK